MMEEGKVAQGGEKGNTVLEAVIKKENTYKTKQKNPKQQKSTRTS